MVTVIGEGWFEPSLLSSPCHQPSVQMLFNCLHPMSDKGRTFLTITSRISSIEVIRIKKNINSGLLVDPIPNSPNRHDKNCMSDGEENY